MEPVILDLTLLIQIFLIGWIGMSLFLIFASEYKWGSPGIKSILAVFVIVVYQLRGKRQERDTAMQTAIMRGAEFFTNVGKMTLVGLAAALLSTTLLYLAFRFGYLVDTTCWFNTCG